MVNQFVLLLYYTILLSSFNPYIGSTIEVEDGVLFTAL